MRDGSWWGEGMGVRGKSWWGEDLEPSMRRSLRLRLRLSQSLSLSLSLSLILSRSQIRRPSRAHLHGVAIGVITR